MKNLFRKITALFMTLCMIVGMMGLPAAAYAEGPDDAAIVAADKDALVVGFADGDSTDGVTENLILATTGVSGSGITWQSDTPEVIAHDGTVTRPDAEDEDAEVTLTAAIAYGEAEDTREFTVTVLKESAPQMLMGPMSELDWGTGDGQSEATAYQVSSAEHLAAIPAKDLAAYYVQTADISLSEAGYTNWTPFGIYAAPFTAHYDGGGYVISGLTVTGSSNNASLFGFVSGNAVIKNVRIENASVAGGVNVGILAGIIADGGGATGGGTIQNCSTSGTVSGSARVGGLIGSVQHGSAVVKESFSTATVSADPSNSSQRGTAGGLAGFVLSGLVQDSYAAGRITAGRYTGGFAGEIQGGTARYCYANAPVAGTYPAGFLGYRQGSPTVADCFYDSDAAGTTSSNGGTAKTTAEMRRQATFTNWDFDSVWSINEDVFYPILRYYDYVWTPDDRIAADLGAITWDLIRGESIRPEAVTGDLNLPLSGGMESTIVWSAEPTGIVNAETGTVTRPADTDETVVLTATVSYTGGTPRTKTFTLLVIRSSFDWVGDGSAEYPYEVSSADHLEDLRNIMDDGVYFIQTANIDLPEAGYTNWTPFGTYAAPFTARYDGDGYVISGLTVTGSNSNASLFGFVSGNAVIKNVRIENASVAGGVNVGILVGIIADGGGATGGGTIRNCSTGGTVTGSARVGGLIGSVQHGSAVVKESFSTATVSADPANSGQSGSAGGLAGFVLSGLVQDSYAAGNVTDGNLTGGFAGEIQGGTVNNCYADGSVTGTSAKGFVGGKSGGTVSGCFYNSGTDLSDPAATGRSAAEMKRQATFVSWNFAAVWKIGDDISTPSLQWQEPWTDDEIISTDLAALKWDDIKGGNIEINFVTGNLAQLPVAGLKGAAITWSAAPTGYIDTVTGALIKREQTADVAVTLTAEASYGAGTARTKAFDLTVKMLELDRYAVVYDANGGTGTPPTESDRAENEPFQAAAADNLQPLEAMRFKEWNTAANGTGTGYEAGATVTMPGNALTLYAIWEIYWIGNGSSQNPFQVPSAAHLDGVRHNMGAHYILTADISLSASGYTNWAPIGTNSNMFTGVFNGNGKSITGLTIDRSGTDYQGLFGAIGSGGLVKNLGLADVSIIGNSNVGGVAGQISGGNVESCYVSGSVRGNGSVGGVVGRFSTGEMRNCYSESDVSGSGSNVGGVAGVIQNGQMFLCYATGNVSGNSFAGGVAGRMLNEGIVMLCAALNPRVTAASSGSRVINVPGSRADDNYAFSGMTVTVNGAAKTINPGVRLADGANLSFDSLFSESFWKDTLFFNTSTIWLIEDYKLPVLRNLAGQSGAPPHLIKLFVDAAKNATEGATYSDMTQAAATGEAAIANALKSDAEAAVNNSSITVTINKVSYTAPTAGDADNPDGINGSFEFTVTVARGLENQTTAQKTITITATAFTGLSNAAAVAAAKAALTDGSVNVAFGASQSDKTEAVQSYVNGLLSAVPNAAGVAANVTYNSATGRYDVALSKGSVNDGQSLTMAVNEEAAYTVTVVNGTGGGSYVQGATVSIIANAAASGRTFDKWTSSDSVTFANASSATTTFTMPGKNVTVTATYKKTGGSSSDSGKNSGGRTPPTPAAPEYNADVKAENGAEITLPVTVDKDAGTASVDAGSQDLAQDGTVITVPSIPDVNTYTVGISVADLSTSSRRGSLIVNTEAGSVTVPSNMLTGTQGISGSRAEISIGQGDKDTLPDDVKAALGDRPLVQLTLSIDGKQTDWSNPNAPVTVSIPYTPTAEELANPESIVIWYIDGSGKAVSVPNGRYDPATGTVTFFTTHFSEYAVAYNKVRFNDADPSAWYNKAVSFIAAREITSGTGNGNYSPEVKLTRGEFIVMMMKAYEITPDANPTDNFSDAGNTYYTGYLAAAKRLGISAGAGNNMYAPGKKITRQEMFTLLYNTLKVIGRLPEGDSGKTLDQFTDAGQIDSWAKGAMTLLVKTGTVGGSAGKLTPLSTTTRAEMAQVLYNLLGK